MELTLIVLIITALSIAIFKKPKAADVVAPILFDPKPEPLSEAQNSLVPAVLPPPKETTPPTPLPSRPTPMLVRFCTAQRDFEGEPGDRNYRNNNPGNFRFSPVGYLAKYGDVRKDESDFAVFPTYAQGWLYLQNHVLQKAKQHPTWTIRNYIDAYAPPDDDNPNNAAYAAAIAKKCGVPVSTTLQELFA